MTAAEQNLYRQAGLLMHVFMGKTDARRGSPAVDKSHLDPLAWWVGVEAIVDLAKNYRTGVLSK